MRFKLKWKKVTAMLTTLVMTLGFLTCFPSGALTLELSAGATGYSGETSEPNAVNGVYQIGTAAELYGFANYVNNGNTSANAVLTSDIVVNEGVLDDNGDFKSASSDSFYSWTPIGSGSNSYAGTFDGNGYTVSGLYFDDSTRDYVGLFGYIGGVRGENDGGTISNCYNTGAVSGSGSNSIAGGVCGNNRNTISNCYNTGTVAGTCTNGSANAGGACGNNYNGSITNCYNTGAVTGTNNTIYSNDIGGVCALNSSGTIISSFVGGDISL